MNESVSAERGALVELAARFAKHSIEPHAARWDRESEFPLTALREAAAAGFAAIQVGEDVGGCGLGHVETTLALECLSAACASFAGYLSVHNTASTIIDKHGSPQQRRAWLPGLASMQKLISFCLSEPGAGSDATAVRTEAVRQGDHYVLNGRKHFITGAGSSDYYLVVASTGGPGSGQLSCLLVERGTPGLSFGRVERKLGWRSQRTGEVVLDQCRVPADCLIGPEHDFLRICARVLSGGRLNIAACSLGPAKSALQLAVKHSNHRIQFGRSLASMPVVQTKMARMFVSVENSRNAIARASQAMDSDAPDAMLLCAMAKRLATCEAFEVINESLQIHGAMGLTEDLPIERWLRDVRGHQIVEGTNEIMDMIIFREMGRASWLV
jgi:alkylation response protein AidB-like acyl-CoA dehydrogenase